MAVLVLLALAADETTADHDLEAALDGYRPSVGALSRHARQLHRPGRSTPRPATGAPSPRTPSQSVGSKATAELTERRCTQKAATAITTSSGSAAQLTAPVPRPVTGGTSLTARAHWATTKPSSSTTVSTDVLDAGAPAASSSLRALGCVPTRRCAAEPPRAAALPRRGCAPRPLGTGARQPCPARASSQTKARGRAQPAPAPAVQLVTSAGTSATFASSVKIRRPSRRAVTDASTSVASDRRAPRSGATVAALPNGIAPRPMGTTTGAELFEAL